MKCTTCNKQYNSLESLGEFMICPSCGGYFRLSAKQRIKLIADIGSFAVFNDIEYRNLNLDFPGYKNKLNESRKKTGLKDSVVSGACKIGGISSILIVMDFHFMGGSLGLIAGKQISHALDVAYRKRLPVAFFAASGGARMQDGVASLIAMSKVSAGVEKLKYRGVPFVSVLTDPTSGGVTASIAMGGDIILAEPNAFVGFAGPRVLKSTGYTIEKNSQTSESMFKVGFIDKIVNREDVKNQLVALLSNLNKKKRWTKSSRKVVLNKIQFISKSNNISSKVTGWEAVIAARDYRRMTSMGYIDRLFDSFFEFHGDRSSGDDGAIIAGVARLGGKSCFVIALERGVGAEDSTVRNFAMASPSGYKKALRLINFAQSFGFPILTLIDTLGANASPKSESEGIGYIIAQLLKRNSSLTVPIVSVIIGQGGSGGALALTNGVDIYMMEDSIFSVISPEGCASILFKDVERKIEAADALNLEATTLLELDLVKGILDFNSLMKIVSVLVR